MKTTLPFIFLFFISAAVSSQNLEWAKALSGPNNDQVSHLTADGNNDIILIGNAGEKFDVDPSEKEQILNKKSKAFITHSYVSKFTSKGDLKWAVSFGDSINSTSARTAAAVDKDNNIIFAGNYSSSIDFDPGEGEYYLHKEHSVNSFITKLNADGEFVFAINITGGKPIIVKGIDADGDGNIYVTGYLSGADTVDFAPGDSTLEITTTDGWDVFVAKYTKNGEISWVKTFWGKGDQFADDIVIKKSGNILITGHFQNEITFNLEPVKLLTDEQGTFDGYIVEMDANGEIVHGTFMSSWGNIYRLGLSLGSNDTIFLEASFTYDINMDLNGEDNILRSPSEDLRNGAYIKYTPELEYVLHNHFLGEGHVFMRTVEVNSKNEVYAMGSFTNDVRFDSMPSKETLITAGLEDVFLARFSTNGTLKCARAFGGPDKELALSIKLITDDEFVFAGDFQGSTDMDPTKAETLLTNNGTGWDAAIALYSMCNDGVYGTSVEYTNAIALKAYPNPVYSLLTVEGITERQPYKVYDQLGKILLQGTLQQGVNSIDFSKCKTGVYFLVTNNGYKKVLVQ